MIAGAEGIGKSTLLNVMGGQWFSDSLTTMEGKLGMEQLRGAWLIELGELSSIKRSDVEQVKSYITRQDDIYRAAYGTVVEKHPRQCVFCGTTNETYFLKGDTGNRRFWVIKIVPELRKHSNIKEAIERDRDQLWAEAVQRWRDGEQLYLPQDLEAEARQRQQEYNDDSDDPLKSLLAVYLDKRLPTDWPSWDLQRRRAYFTQSDPLDAEGVTLRDRVCVAEFICEQMGRSMADKEYKYMARRIAKLLDEFDGWERVSVSRHAEKLYGRQKAWVRKEVDNEGDI
jgi:predicted P-loop ATPase